MALISMTLSDLRPTFQGHDNIQPPITRLMGGLLHLVQRGGTWAGWGPALTVPNVIAHPSTASVPVYQLHII